MDLDLKNVENIKRIRISFISSEKAFLCSRLSFLQQENDKNTEEWHCAVPIAGKGLKLDTPLCYSCSWLNFLFRLLTVLSYESFAPPWPTPAGFPAQRAPEIFLPYFTGISPAPNSPFGSSKSFLCCPSGLCRLLPLIRQHLLQEIASLSCSAFVRAFYKRDAFLGAYS